ncbi:MAG: choice-of-anchor tandem repeat GloVer-containing protein [Terriglobales bacterium]
MKNPHGTRLQVLAVVIAILAASATTLRAQTYTDLYNLGSNTGDPENPAWIGLFAQGRDGNLYSTTMAGGTSALGTAFQLSTTGTILPWSFDGKGTDGAYPYSGLTLGTDGNFYGTTNAGGLGAGTVFKVTTTGKITTLYSFTGFNCCAYAAPIEGLDGNYYGTTSDGGGEVFGTVYKMTPAGKVTFIYTFPGTSGLAYPQAVTLGTDGNFYGTALGGGANRFGGVFKITPGGKLTVLHSFGGTPDGQTPKGAIIQASDGNFYGTTEAGGADGFGSIYKMTPAGVLTVLHSFNETDGMGLHPLAGLVQATDGKFYGAAGSNTSSGVLFQITSKGTYTVLLNLTNTTGNFPGANPQVALFQHTKGTLYGDTYGGGTGKLCFCGVLYSLGMKLGPFVSFVGPLFEGKVGKTIEILGQGFTGATKVSFHGVAATFAVVSDTYLTAVVPAGATTGFVTVTTPGGILTSNKIFRVTPQILSFKPTSGTVGTIVTITGVSLTQTSKVTFGGVKATSFTVNSDTRVTATVPTGAVTGHIAITTPGGTAVSSGIFTVTQ